MSINVICLSSQSSSAERSPSAWRLPPRRKRTPNTYNDMKSEKFRQLSLQKTPEPWPRRFSFCFAVFGGFTRRPHARRKFLRSGRPLRFTQAAAISPFSPAFAAARRFSEKSACAASGQTVTAVSSPQASASRFRNGSVNSSAVSLPYLGPRISRAKPSGMPPASSARRRAVQARGLSALPLSRLRR